MAMPSFHALLHKHKAKTAASVGSRVVFAAGAGRPGPRQRHFSAAMWQRHSITMRPRHSITGWRRVPRSRGRRGAIHHTTVRVAARTQIVQRLPGDYRPNNGRSRADTAEYEVKTTRTRHRNHAQTTRRTRAGREPQRYGPADLNADRHHFGAYIDGARGARRRRCLWPPSFSDRSAVLGDSRNCVTTESASRAHATPRQTELSVTEAGRHGAPSRCSAPNRATKRRFRRVISGRHWL